MHQIKAYQQSIFTALMIWKFRESTMSVLPFEIMLMIVTKIWNCRHEVHQCLNVYYQFQQYGDCYADEFKKKQQNNPRKDILHRCTFVTPRPKWKHFTTYGEKREEEARIRGYPWDEVPCVHKLNLRVYVPHTLLPNPYELNKEPLPKICIKVPPVESHSWLWHHFNDGKCEEYGLWETYKVQVLMVEGLQSTASFLVTERGFVEDTLSYLDPIKVFFIGKTVALNENGNFTTQENHRSVVITEENFDELLHYSWPRWNNAIEEILIDGQNARIICLSID